MAAVLPKRKPGRQPGYSPGPNTREKISLAHQYRNDWFDDTARLRAAIDAGDERRAIRLVRALILERAA